MKRSFFQAAVVSILLYGCTTWTLTKRLEKKLDGNYTIMLRAILNKSWRQQPARHQLYGHLPPITKTIQVRRTRHAGHCWRSKDELISNVLLWTPTYGQAKSRDDQLKHTYSSYVRIRDVNPKTCQRRWMIGRSGERGSGISVLAAGHGDDDECHRSFERKRKEFSLFFASFSNFKILFLKWRHCIITLSVCISYRCRKKFKSLKMAVRISYGANTLESNMYLTITFPQTRARGVVVIVVGNEHGDTSSYPGRDWLHYT